MHKDIICDDQDPILRCGSDPTPWDVARLHLVGLKDSETVTLTAGQGAWLIVLFIADLGYLVTGSGKREKDYFTLIERSLGDDPVSAFDGGNMNEYPRHTFVSQPLMLKAAEVYYRTGQRDPNCEWVPAEDAVYD
jgi:hypothetical protein